MPAGAALICPAPDLSLPGASWHAEPLLDYLTRPIANSWLVHYVDPPQYSDPFASPIHGDLRGLPAIFMQAGGNEGLLDEIEILATALRSAEVDLTFEITDEMPHVWHLFAGMIPEADRALEAVAKFVATVTQSSPSTPTPGATATTAPTP